ncbi:MAG: AMP-binding protein [Rhodospirillaceae bacterium]|jgi:malonyl-CoA/methylmalonyl-CoA synthetase
MSANLYSVFRKHFLTDLNHPFITHADGTTISYCNVEQASAQFANALTALGLSKGDRVAVQVEKSTAALMLYLGCLRAGVVYLPLNTAYSGKELSYFLNDATPKLIVCDPSRLTEISGLLEHHKDTHCLTLDANGNGSAAEHMKVHAFDFNTVECNEADLAALLYSSGTTGQPKGAMLSHGALAANARSLKAVWHIKPGDVVLHALPIFHTHGLFVATNTVLLSGASLRFHPKFEPKEVVKALAKSTIFMGVPTYYTRLLKEPELTEEACASIRLFICGSAPLREETFNAFTAKTGHTIVERYGMTEAGIITSATLETPRMAGTVGKPLKTVLLRVCNKHDKPVSAGEVGDVQIQGPSLFSGYWNKPEKTADDFTNDGFFRTGDIGLIGPDGQLVLVGRAKDMFISGGFNVFPKEIEQALDTLEGVEESAIVGMPHPDFGEAGLAIVVANNKTFDGDQLRLDLKAHLANYKVPKAVIRADALPRNAMGKVQKNVLREMYKTEWDKII